MNSEPPAGAGVPAVSCERVPVGDVISFAEAFFRSRRPHPTAPITPERARSLSANPHAQPGDPALAVAWSDGLCVGFQQVFPGLLRTGGETTRVFWLCGGYVIPEMRNRGVFGQLAGALIGTGVELVSTAYSPGVERALRRLGFREFGPLPFLVVYLRKAHLGRRTRLPALRDIADGRRWAARNLAAMLRRTADPGIRARTLERLGDLPRPSRLGNHSLPRFDRDTRTVQWMLDHPWVRDDAPPVEPPFHFVDRRQAFRYRLRELSDASGGRRGYFLSSFQQDAAGSRVTLLDHELDDPGLLGSVLADLWADIAEGPPVDEVILPDGAWKWLGRSQVFRHLAHRFQRPYLARPSDAGSPLARNLDALQLQYVDCDAAFC